MLIDIECPFTPDPILDRLGSMRGSSAGAARISVGMYEIGHFNFNLMLPGGCQAPWSEDRTAPWIEYPEIGELSEFRGRKFGSMSSYGVCDSPEQFLAHDVGRWVSASERRFVVSFTRVRKADQPASGGWRWHKWGEYIGEQDPQYEYLADEDGIDEVFCFAIYERAP